jgi:hypothetical protein
MSQLVGLANNTKWSELQTIMSEHGVRAPYWRTQATNGFVYPPTGWDADWHYHFRLGEYKHIEWCEMAPRETVNSLSVEEVVAICTAIGFEFTANEKLVKIIGYRRV